MKQIAKLHRLLAVLSALVFSFTDAAAQSSALGNATTRTYSDGLLDLRGPVNLSLDDTNTTKTKFTTYFANRIARENGRLWVWKAGKFVLLDSVSGGGSSIDTTSLSNRIDARVKYTDTAAMLAAYLRKSDTTSLSNRIDARVKYIDTAVMLAPYLRKADTAYLSNRINTKQDALTLTTTGTSGAATLIGSILNIPNYATGSGTVTSIATTTGTGITGGTITTSGTLALDTTNTVSTKDYRRKGTDSLGVIIATKLNITDTANMRVRLAAGSNISLSGSYPNITIAASGSAIDSTVYSTRAWRKKGDDSLGILIATKQGYSDTTTYDATKKNLADTAAALRAAIGSGGGGGISGTISASYIPYATGSSTVANSPISRISSTAVGINTNTSYAGSDLNVQRYMEFSTSGGGDFTHFGQETGYFFIQPYNGGRLSLMPLGNAVVVGGSASSPSSASLDIQGNSRYFYPNRGTNSQKGSGTPAAGAMYYCTDCTATDASTGVLQVYNGSTWKNCW